MANQASLRVILDLTSEYPTAILYDGDQRVGHCHVDIEGVEAELVDIVIYSFPHSNPVLRLFGRRISYRRKGYGTALLNEVIERLAHAGVRRVWGKIVGEDYLPAWYRSMGFTVDEASMRMEKQIGSDIEPVHIAPAS